MRWHHIPATFLAAYLSLITFPPNAYAGAWTQPKGVSQLIFSVNTYDSHARFSPHGTKISHPRYSRQSVNPYFEYGWSDALTLGGSASLDRAYNGTQTNTGLSDSSFFFRQRLWHDKMTVTSIQPTVVLQSFTTNQSKRPALGSTAPSAGINAQLGRSFTLFDQSHYADTSIAYYYRFGNAHDQVRASLTIGLRLTDRFTLMPQLFQTWAMQSPSGNASFTQSTRDDYDLTQLQLSLLYALNAENAIQCGVYHSVYGKNAGDGIGVVVAYWRSF